MKLACSGRAPARPSGPIGRAVARPLQPEAEDRLATGAVPGPALRLFPHHGPQDLPAAPGFVIGRLLEDGDGEDLRWLFATFGEAPVQRWFAERGGRQLSARSRAFWRQVLGCEPAAPATGSGDLWPL